VLGDGAYIAGARFRRGLPQAAEGCQLPPCPCSKPRVSLDHAMICRHLSGLVTQQHDHLVMTWRWRRTMAGAGLHSAAEPHLGLARREREAQCGVELRGDFTMPMPSGVIDGDVSIVHPAVPCFAAAATMIGTAARNRDTKSPAPADGRSSGAARAGGGVSFSASTGVCRSAYGAVGRSTFMCSTGVCPSTRLAERRYCCSL
jgi:hypothetical protein